MQYNRFKDMSKMHEKEQDNEKWTESFILLISHRIHYSILIRSKSHMDMLLSVVLIKQDYN